MHQHQPTTTTKAATITKATTTATTKKSKSREMVCKGQRGFVQNLTCIGYFEVFDGTGCSGGPVDGPDQET